MKKIPLLVFVSLFLGQFFSSHAEDAAKPAPFPSELKLTSGTVIHRAEAVRFEADRVIVKHLGGTDPVFYRNIDESQRPAVIAAKDAATKAKDAAAKTEQEKANAAEEAANTPVHYTGEIFVVTNGKTNVKLGDVEVNAFREKPDEIMDLVKRGAKHPEALASTSTDSEGRFDLPVKPAAGKFTLVAHSTRLVGGKTEFYLWVISSDDIKTPAKVILSNSNMTPDPVFRVSF